MTRLVWGETRHYEAGVDRGVFYPKNGTGVVWNGLISVEESPSDADSNPRYLDGIRVGNQARSGGFSATVEAFTYPAAFEDWLDSSRRIPFDMSYRTMTDEGYRIHLIYNAKARSSDANRQYDDPSTFNWELTTIPVAIPGATPVAHFMIDSTIAYPEALQAFEDMIYGTDSEEPRLPSPTEIVDMFESHALLRVFDNGDGTFTVDGPDSAIQMLDEKTFQIDWPSAVYLDANSYRIGSF
jgi:hypothetical protein